MISGVSASTASYPFAAPAEGTVRRAPAASASTELSVEDLRIVTQLQQRDREVRAHEQAHIAAGGDLITSGPSYSYQTGPDNQRYAIGGEVGIDTSPARTPEETLAKAARIRAAALAPAAPSAQDMQVAASADRLAMEARMELSQQRSEGTTPPDRREQALAWLVASVSSESANGSTIDTYA